MTVLRPIRPADHEAVLAINERHVEALSPLDHERLVLLLGLAAHAELILAEDAVAGFVLTFAPGTAYDSENYRWFSGRYDDFLYLDRIAIDPAYQRRGLASRVYDELEAAAMARGRMVLEVNADNEPSLAFHRARGYAEIAPLGKVILMAKEL
jgi:predicted GNAT superfamily acetyltransferase